LHPGVINKLLCFRQARLVRGNPPTAASFHRHDRSGLSDWSQHQQTRNERTLNPCQIGRNLLTILAAGLVLSACQTTNQPASTAASANGGHLTIHRAPNLGVDLIIWIDGGSKVVLRPADTFNTDLAPGQHTINMTPWPNEEGQPVSKLTLTVENRKTYSFTGSRAGDVVALTQDL
jgi:hypothetical protein